MTAPGAAQPGGQPGWQQPQPTEEAAPQAQPPALGYAGAPAPARAYASAPAPSRGYASAPAPARSYTAYGAAAAAAPVAAAAQVAAPARAGHGVQAEAREPASAAQPSTSATPARAASAPAEPRRSRSGSGAFHVAQFLSWQIAGAAVLAAYRAGLAAAVVVAGLALPLLVPTLIRWRGRWLYRWLGLWLRFRTRRHQVPATGTSQALDLLTFAEESVALDSVEIDGRDIALLAHRGGLCAVFELGPDDDALLVGEPVALPSPAALLPAADAQTPPVTAQLLVSITSAPLVFGLGAVDRSYRELAGGEVPAHRQAWLVLQGVRTPDAFADGELRPALVSAVRRARRQLRQERVAARLLDRDELLTAVAHLARLSAPVTAGNVYGTAPQKKIGRETWRAWWTEDTPQSCHRLVRLPAQPWQIDTLLRHLPTVGGVLSLAVARDRSRATAGDDLAIEVAFRLAATDLTTLGYSDQALDAAVRSGGGRTERLDGEQIAGLAATLPLGGFLQ